MPKDPARFTKTIVTYADKDLVFQIQNIPAGMHVTKAILMVKTQKSDVDASAIITKAVTDLYVAGVGQVIDNGLSDQVAVVQFELQPADTALLNPAITYYPAVKVIYADGNTDEFPIESFRPIQGGVRATA